MACALRELEGVIISSSGLLSDERRSASIIRRLEKLCFFNYTNASNYNVKDLIWCAQLSAGCNGCLLVDTFSYIMAVIS